MEINGTLEIDGEQLVCMTIEIHGEKYKFKHTAPAELKDLEELKAYVAARLNSYRLDILRDIYPGAIIFPGDVPELERFEAWISAGCKNVIDGPDGPVETVIEKKQWKGKHPPMETGITVLEFRQKFTINELVAIKTSADPIIGVFVDDLHVAPQVHLDNPRVIEGMNYLVSVNVISEKRKAEILGSE